MATMVWLVLMCGACALAVPTIVFAIECIAGALPFERRRRKRQGDRPSVAVVIPAHDEELGIAATVKNVLAQIRPGDRLLVVADNCTDATAARARAAGAQIIERDDPLRRGKGYALEFGVAFLADEPPAAIVFIDADCTLLDGSLDKMASLAIESGRPVQASYLMQTRSNQKKAFGIAEFAFLVKNHVRPRGLHRLGLPCQLTGSGMAMPWELAQHVRLAGAEMVEDMKLGLDLAAAGHFPLYCEEAGVRSFFPDTAEGAATQRERWEGGHIGILASGLRRLASVRTWSVGYAAMVLDVMVPPLAFLVLLVALLTVSSATAALSGVGTLPLLVAAGLTVLLGCAVLLAWATHGQAIVPLRSLSKAPLYALGKAALYARILLGRSERAWVRTGRGTGRTGQMAISRNRPIHRLD